MAYGIDIGTTTVKVVAVRRTLGGFRLAGAARRRLPRAADPRAVTLKVLQDALGARNGRRAGVVGLSGRDLNLQVLQQPAMKPLNYRVMMGYELDQRRGESTDLYLDYCTLREPDSYFPQYLALIGIAKRAYVDERIDLLSRASVDVRDAVPNAFALFAAHRHAYGSEGGTVMLLDVGSDNMDIAFVRGGRLVFARNVSSGARIFDQNIANAASVSPEEGEALKVAYGTLGPLSEGLPEDAPEVLIRAPIRSAAGQLTGFISASINHAKLQLNDREFAVDKIYVSGGGARLRGLPEYLAAALKIPVEVLDPFRKLDGAEPAVEGAEEFRRLPSDMAVAIGLAQLTSPGADGSTLSILPAALKKRRNFFRSGLWLAAAGVALAATLLVLTGAAVIDRSRQVSALEDYKSRTSEISRRISDMDALELELRDSSAKLDFLMSHLSPGRGALDGVARLRKVVPPGVMIREVRLLEPEARRDPRAPAGTERSRVAFTFRGRGLVVGELESETDDAVRLKGHADAYPKGEMAGGLVSWPAAGKSLLISGEVDENIRNGPTQALLALRDQMADPARGVTAELRQRRELDKPRWRVFEIVLSFE